MSEIIAGKIQDKSLIRLFLALKEAYGARHMAVLINGVPVPEDQFDLLLRGSSPSMLISDANFQDSSGKFGVQLARSDTKPNLNPAYYDVLKFTPNNGQISVAEILEVEAVLKKFVKLPNANDARALAENTIGIIDRETAALAGLHQRMLDDAQELRASFEQADLERKHRFDEFQAKAEEDIRNKEHASTAAIKAQEAELSAKIAEFDLSDHMRARRKQRQDITDQIQGVLIGPQSGRSSLPKILTISALCLGAFAFAGFFAYESFESFLSRATSTTATAPQSVQVDYLMWLLAARGVVLSGVAFGFLVYLLTFVRKSHDEDVRYHRDLQRYSMDVNRASWVIETAMEMTTKENATLPEKWIEGATANLFQTSNSKSSEVNSLSALGAVLGLGPEIETGPEGTKVRLNGKATKAASKDTE